MSAGGNRRVPPKLRSSRLHGRSESYSAPTLRTRHQINGRQSKSSDATKRLRGLPDQWFARTYVVRIGRLGHVEHVPSQLTLHPEQARGRLIGQRRISS